MKTGVANALEVASRRWPGPDPVHFAKREAIRHFVLLDSALRNVVRLSARADEIVFLELATLHIDRTITEDRLTRLRAELQSADNHVGDILDLLAAARTENDIRECEQELRERQAESRCG